jgi:arsenate reductase
MKKPKVLFLCTGNSCRSHMAEGLLRHLAGDLLMVFSAGSQPVGYVHPQAIAVLAEVGVDISNHTSKHLDQFWDAGIDVVITVCDSANEACPNFPNAVRRHHWGFPDPPKDVRPGESEIDAFRRIRDDIARVIAAYADGYRDNMLLFQQASAALTNPL